MDPNWFKSVVGVAGFAVIAAQFLKKTLVDVTGLNKVPLVVYVMALAGLGTWFAHSVLGTLPVEEGSNFWVLLTTVVTAALVAVGGWEVVTNVAKPLADSNDPPGAPRNFFGTKLVLPLFLVVGLTASACATRNGVQLSPEGTLALRGNQLVSALRSLSGPAGSSPLELLVASKTITVDEAVQVATVVKDGMVIAQDLATVLKVVDEATDEVSRAKGLQRASVLVQTLHKNLTSAPLRIVSESGRKAVLGVLEASLQILLTVGSILPAPTVAALPPGVVLEGSTAWGKDDFWEYLSRFSGWLGSFHRDDSMRECLAAGGCNHIGVRG